jgi:hypothetical protein
MRLKGVRFEFEPEDEGKKPGRCCANLSGFILRLGLRLTSQPARRRVHSGEGKASAGESLPVRGAASGGDGTFVEGF